MGSITATNLATYQHLSCDLYIHKAYQSPRSTGSTTSTSQKQPASLIQSPGLKQSESLKAELRRGLEWEQQLLSHLDRLGLLLRIPHIPVTEGTLLENIIADERRHFFISGVSFLPPNDILKTSFQQYGSHPIQFGLAKPDLIEIERVGTVLKWRVIDAKASKHPKPTFLGTDQPAVWLPPHNRPQLTASFDDIHAIAMSLLDASFRSLLFRDLPRIIHSTPDDLDWHFNAACRDCQYQTTCESTVVHGGLLSNISNLSREDGRILKQLLGIARKEATAASTDPLPDIEELHQIFAEPQRRETIRNIAPEILEQSERILMLDQGIKPQGKSTGSLLTQAYKSKTAKAIPRFNYSCPSHEDIAVVISVFDPRSTFSSSDYLYCISVYGSLVKSTSHLCVSTTFIQELASVIRRIDACRLAGRKPTCQFYTWNATEHAHLQSLLASEVPSFTEDDRQICLQTLAQGTTTTMSKHHPRVLQKVLTNFLRRGSRSDCRILCDRLGIPNQGSREMLEKRINKRMTLLRTGHEITGEGEGFRTIGQLSPVVILKPEIERQLVIPIPGSWDLHEYALKLLPGPSSSCSIEEMLRKHREGDTQSLEETLKRRNDTIYSVLEDFRNRAKLESGGTYLLNKAARLSLQNPILCEEPNIRRLFTLQQLEVFSKLNSLWRSRVEQCGDATVVVYRETLESNPPDEHRFDVIRYNAKNHPIKESGLLPYSFILAKTTTDNGINFPVEALFDDSTIADANPQTDNTVLSGWEQQDPRVRDNILLGHVRRVSARRGEGAEALSLTIRTWGKKSLLSPGATFRLLPRLVDFNTPKILASLFETDVKWTDLEKSKRTEATSSHHSLPLLQLITDPTSLERPLTPETEKLLGTARSIQANLVSITESGVSIADSLVLKPSQQRAVDSVLRNRLSVVWGPPGTGKTHTVALSLLRLLEAEYPRWGGSQYTVIVTAVTHTAIQECYRKLMNLMQGYRSSRPSGLEWMEDVDVQVIDGLLSRSANSRKRARIWLGTIYQVPKILKFHSTEADCVVVDEASQLPLNLLSLAVQFLRNDGRVIFAGDSEQLAPIFATKCASTRSDPFFRSVLEHLLASKLLLTSKTINDKSPYETVKSRPQEEYVTQLRENFRLHTDACSFISTIYADEMEPQEKKGIASRALASSQDVPIPHGFRTETFLVVKSLLQSLYTAIQTRTSKYLDPANNSLDINRPPINASQIPQQSLSLALVHLTYPSELSHINHESRLVTEASVAYALAHILHGCSPSSRIVIATPYRDQKEAVQSLISKARRADTSNGLVSAMETLSMNDNTFQNKVVVDTIERLQGSEADFVICLFSMLHSKRGDNSFIFDRRRLNVAISRAKALCILVTTEEVLSPAANVLSNESTLKGYQFLKAYEERAWRYDLPITVADEQ